MSNHEKIVALANLQKEIRELDSALYTKTLQLRAMQKECSHEIVVHFGDEKLPQMYNTSYRGDFYCLHCGMRNFMVTQDERYGKSFILEAANYKGHHPELNLREVEKIYFDISMELNALDASDLVKHMSLHYGIPYYRANLTEW